MHGPATPLASACPVRGDCEARALYDDCRDVPHLAPREVLRRLVSITFVSLDRAGAVERVPGAYYLAAPGHPYRHSRVIYPMRLPVGAVVAAGGSSGVLDVTARRVEAAATTL